MTPRLFCGTSNSPAQMRRLLASWKNRARRRFPRNMDSRFPSAQYEDYDATENHGVWLEGSHYGRSSTRDGSHNLSH